MTARNPNAVDGLDVPTVKQPEDLDGAEAHILAERLDTLSNRLALDITQLSNSIEQGEEISIEEVEEIRESLRRVEDSLDRHLTEPEQEPEEIPIEQRWHETRELDLDGDLDGADRLIEAPAEEVSWLFNSDLREIRRITQTVDHNLLRGRLLDHHAGLLYAAGNRLRAWAFDVLNLRLDGEILLDSRDRDRLSEEQKRRLGLLDRDHSEEEGVEASSTGSSSTEEPDTFGAPLGYE